MNTSKRTGKNGYQYDFNRVESEFKLVFESSDRLSQFGGLHVLLEFLRKGQFKRRLRDLFGEERARSILQLLIGIIAGADRMVGVARAGEDPLIARFLGRPVGEAQLGRDFRSFSKSQIEALHDWVMSLAVLDLVREIPHSESLVFDVDATAVKKFGDQEGVEHGYIEKGKIEECYQYLFFRIENLETLLHGTLRAGSTHSQNGYCDYLRRFLPLFKKQWQTVWRTDSGFYSEAAIDLYTENEATFFCKAPMTEGTQKLVYSPDLVWRDAGPSEPGVQLASFLTRTAKGTHFRFIFKRKAVQKAQLGLFDAVTYEHHALATNDLVLEEAQAYRFYNKRANLETSGIRELKQHYALGQIVTESFDANDVITQVTLMAYLLMSHFKRQLLPREMRRSQLGTLRWQVFNIPGRMLSTARRSLLKIWSVYKDGAFYSNLMYRLKRMRSWVLAPPLIEGLPA